MKICLKQDLLSKLMCLFHRSLTFIPMICLMLTLLCAESRQRNICNAQPPKHRNLDTTIIFLPQLTVKLTIKVLIPWIKTHVQSGSTIPPWLCSKKEKKIFHFFAMRALSATSRLSSHQLPPYFLTQHSNLMKISILTLFSEASEEISSQTSPLTKKSIPKITQGLRFSKNINLGLLRISVSQISWILTHKMDKKKIC